MTNPDVEIAVTPPPQITIEVDVNGPPGPQGRPGKDGTDGSGTAFGTAYVVSTSEDGHTAVITAPWLSDETTVKVFGGRTFKNDIVTVFSSEDQLVAVSGGSARFKPRYAVGISSGYGLVSQSAEDRERELRMYADLGISMVRIDVDWSDIERVQGTYDWSVVDHTFNAAEKFGLTVVGILAYTPEWATTVPGENHAPPTNMADYAAFCAAAVSRYPSEVWELWNEPNIHFWQPLPDPVGYTSLTRAAYTAIKAADPTATVLAGALSPAVDEVDGTGIAPATFTAACYAEGIKDHFDAWSVHPYCYPATADDETTKAWNTFQRLPLIHDVMVANGDGDKKIWLTEFGAPTGTHPTAVSEQEQAQQLVIGLVQSLIWKDWTGPLFIYCGRDPGVDPAVREDMFGLVRRDWSPKPSFYALQDALRFGVNVPVGAETPQSLKIGGAAGTQRYLEYQTAGKARWKIGANPDIEDPLVPGSGSNFVIARYDEDETFIDNSLDINRRTGTVSMSDVWMRDGAINAVSHLYISNDVRPILGGEAEPVLGALLAALEEIGLIVDNTVPATGGGGGGSTGPFMSLTVEGLAEDYKAFRMKSADTTRFEWGLARDSEGGDLSLRRHDKVTGAYLDSPIYVDADNSSVYTNQLGIQSVDNTKITLNVVAASNNPVTFLFRVALPDGTSYLSVGWDGTVRGNWGSNRFGAVKLGCTQVVREGAGPGNTIFAGYTSTANADADNPVFEVRGSGAVKIGPAEQDTDAVQKAQVKAIAAAATSFADFQARMAAW